MPEYPHQNLYTYTPDNLIAGLSQLVSETGTLLSGQNLPRGALVGKITASGKFVLSTAAATNGSQNPFGVLYDDYDATAADMLCGVYVKGEFNAHAITFGAGQTAANVHDALRSVGIFLKPVVSAS